jgi:glycosyl transferase family 25
MTLAVVSQIPVFIINLDSSPERYLHAEQQLQALGITAQRFRGVYGKDLSAAQIAACYDSHANLQYFRRSLSLGEIGCYLSHRGVWQLMLDQQIDVAIVLEDDIDIEARFQAALAQISRLHNWDLIKLSDDRDTPAYARKPIDDGFELANFKRVPNCATGYAISRRGAEKMLQRQRFYRPVDLDLQFGAELGLELFSLLPYTIWPCSKFDSVINQISGGSRKGDTSAKRNLRYRCQVFWQRWRYQSGDLTKVSFK